MLWALTKHPFEPNDSIDLKYLTWKTVILVALASAARESEIHALSIKASNYREDSAGIRLLPNLQFLAKTQRLGKAWNPIFSPRFDRFATESDNLLLCPCRCLKMYRRRIKHLNKRPKCHIAHLSNKLSRLVLVSKKKFECFSTYSS